MNRYIELTDAQKDHVDAYVNAIASRGQTEITRGVEHWVEEARAILKTSHGGGLRHCLAMIMDATVRPTLVEGPEDEE